MLRIRSIRPEQHEVLAGVAECNLSLLAWLCTGFREWCMKQDEPSTVCLLATGSGTRRGQAGPLLRYRLSMKTNIRGSRRNWKEDGAAGPPGADAVMRHVCSTHLSNVKNRFADVPVLELCFDASQVSIRQHDLFAVYTPTGFGGDGTCGEGVATYLPPVRVPELAWRVGDAHEEMTQQDRGWWTARGWKSRRGVRSYQSMRSVEHVLVNMLSTKITDFIAPKGLSKMSAGDTRAWDEQEGRWY